MFGYINIIDDLVVERLMSPGDEDIPVIITAKDCNCDDLEQCVARMGGKIKHKLNIINAVSAYLPTPGVRSAARERNIQRIHLDDKAYKLMDIASVTVGSDTANEYGLTGRNVSIAVVDTGVYPHNDLITPTNRIIAFKDFVGNKSTPYDDDGHGTHVAGTIAGNGFASKGKYMGIAPDANIVGIKVLNQDGSGNISDVIAGIQWAIQNKDKYNIKILTLSLGTKAKGTYQDDPLCRAVDAATSAGITVVAAAGNNGPERSTINSPAISPNIISVGACDDRNAGSISIADFSSRGPTPEGLIKPDIIAPGVKITSLKNERNEYQSLSGTSMATPIVAGCAALLYEHNPDYNPQQVKSIMTQNATPLGFNQQDQGAGLLDIKRIVSTLDIKPKQQPPRPNPGYPITKGPGSSNLFSSFNQWFWIILIVLLVLVL